MFVRKKKNKSGSVSIQILQKVGKKNKLVKTVGSSNNQKEIEKLYQEAINLIPTLERQPRLELLSQNDSFILNFIKSLKNSNISMIGAELVFGRLYKEIGFDIIKEPLLKELVISRIIYQGSKLKLIEYLRRYEHKSISIWRIYRFLDKFNSKYKEQIEEIAFKHTKKILNQITVVFYDMTTLYFEAQDEDDFRKIGFSKDGKFQNPQIMLGLLVGKRGYPIGYELFKGNTFEGKTLIPVLEKFQDKFNLAKPIIIADSGLLSKKNIDLLKEKGYEYILGARVKNETDLIKKKILNLELNSNKDITYIDKSKDERLIITYTQNRAKKDEYNRKKGLKRLEKRVSSGKLTKENINNRGYNRYLILKDNIEVEIDYKRFEEDSKWDGLKGYITNTSLPAKEVVQNYNNLWQIEKAFRMSKSDLEIRPIYHYVKRRIEAHISISFIAYTIYKEMERLIYKYKAPFSVSEVKDIVKTMYQLKITLPDSNSTQTILLDMNEEQKFLLEIINNEFG